VKTYAIKLYKRASERERERKRERERERDIRMLIETRLRDAAFVDTVTGIDIGL